MYVVVLQQRKVVGGEQVSDADSDRRPATVGQGREPLRCARRNIAASPCRDRSCVATARGAHQQAELVRMHATGDHTIAELTEVLSVGRATVHRVLDPADSPSLSRVFGSAGPSPRSSESPPLLLRWSPASADASSLAACSAAEVSLADACDPVASVVAASELAASEVAASVLAAVSAAGGSAAASVLVCSSITVGGDDGFVDRSRLRDRHGRGTPHRQRPASVGRTVDWAPRRDGVAGHCVVGFTGPIPDIGPTNQGFHEMGSLGFGDYSVKFSIADPAIRAPPNYPSRVWCPIRSRVTTRQPSVGTAEAASRTR
ncbi:hypothetical protein EV192_1011676 [Actinocrispum wychmicini]|uniref:Uncharacterized protein n=1 Tax=Actinocrispum wychmicini TaxID=1213861 RepID=A0A4R2K0S2_9PSEU|nr:hypothetical protein EV192_1011676 [Actinocrispum wychmicini]